MTVKLKRYFLTEWLKDWHVNPSINSDYDAIDGLRGIAILMVVAFHLAYVDPAYGLAVELIGAVISAGNWGVTIFFTLSGFLISYPFWKRKIRGTPPLIPPGYGWRRFWKIYPPLALSIVLLTPIYILRTNDTSFLVVASQWLVGWPLVHPVDGRLNAVMWSLIVEVHFYILLPLLFLCLKRVSVKLCLGMISLTLLVVPTAFRWWNLSQGVHTQLHPEIEIHFPSLLDAFAFGTLLAGLENLKIIKKSWAWLGDLGFILLFAAMLARWRLNLHPLTAPLIQSEILDCVVKLAAALMLCYIANSNHPRSRLLSQPWLRWCGLISYEWYLFHQPIYEWAKEIFGRPHGSILKYGLLVGGSFICGLVIAATIYRYFSLPILKYGRNRH